MRTVAKRAAMQGSCFTTAASDIQLICKCSSYGWVLEVAQMFELLIQKIHAFEQLCVQTDNRM
jgi:hypothetical protein